MTPTSPFALALAAFVGLLAGTHASIWGMYKDAIHEGFGRARFSRSMIVGALVALAIHATLALPLPEPSALVVLFGLAYAAERGIVEVWKTFVRDEDQSKYFIPMQFSLGGVPVRRRAVRLAAGAAYVAVVLAGLWALSRVRDSVPGAPLDVGRAALLGLAAGMLIAVGGAWKDAPKEGFDPVKFFRSPSFTVVLVLLLSRLADSHLHATVAAIGFERAIVETWKTFFFPNKPRGKFAGMPISHPAMLTRRQRFVPVYVAIWVAVLASGVLAFAGGPRQARAVPPATPAAPAAPATASLSS